MICWGAHSFLMFGAALIIFGATGQAIAAEETALPLSAMDTCPLKIGMKVPQVVLISADGKPFELSDAISQQPTVLIFYRGGWCPYCNAQLGQLQKIEPEFLALGYQLIAVSPDRPEELKKSVAKQQLSYTLISDSKADAAKAFGLAFRVDDNTFARLKEYNIDLEAAAGEGHHLLPVPAVFLVGKDGIIDFSYINPNYRERLSPELLLTAAKMYAQE
ncbi:MAG: hypothetical protein AUJ92_01040 [Armatimonadetes bacterium CG2_30_59_28]|nr:MAG: hypothetical protein AUJ92_01040 [Armatimonadetes bacterium CG2_30_59_28]